MDPHPLSRPTRQGCSIPLEPGLFTTTRSSRRHRAAQDHLGPTLGGGCSPAQPPQGPAPQGEAVGQGHGEGRELGISRLQSRRWCPSVSANLAWPKSQGSGAAAFLKGVTWGQGSSFPSTPASYRAPGAPWKLGGRGIRGRECWALPLALWLQDGQRKGQLLSLLPSRRGTRGCEQVGPAPFQLFFTGFTGLGYQELQLPGPVWRPPLNWFGRELSSKIAPPVSLSHSHFLYSLIRVSCWAEAAWEPHPGTPRPRQVGAGCIAHLQAKGVLSTCSEAPWSFDSYWPWTQVLGAMPSWLP